MKAPNHVVGGLVWTSFFGSLFCGTNIFASPLAIFLTCFFSLLPDIDHSKSVLGKTPGLGWMASWINRKYGHRTITHSFFALGLGTTLLAVFSSTWASIFFLAYSSHIVFDTFTLAGVPFFYPFSRTVHCLVTKRSFREFFSSFQGEAVFFCSSVILLIILLNSGLVEKGFWTSYNQTFATPNHVFSEFAKADDLLKVEYHYKEGTESFKGEGYLIESSGTKMTLLQQKDSSLIGVGECNHWLILEESKTNIVSTVPHHTGKNYRFENLSFINIDLDSLNQLTRFGAIRELDLVANNEFLVTADGVGERSKKFKADYVSNVYFEIDDQTIEKENFAPQSNPRISSLQLQIQHLQRRDALALAEYQSNQKTLNNLESTISAAASIYELEQQQKRIKQLRAIKTPQNNELLISELRAQIAALKKSDYLKNSNKKMEMERKYRQALPAATRFTGFARVVVIEERKTDGESAR